MVTKQKKQKTKPQLAIICIKLLIIALSSSPPIHVCLFFWLTTPDEIWQIWQIPANHGNLLPTPNSAKAWINILNCPRHEIP